MFLVGLTDTLAGGALGVSKFALGVRISSAFLVALNCHKFGKVSGVIVKGVKMNYLDIVARLIVLGCWVFVAVWVWSILHTPKTGRSCVSCAGELSEYDLANCFKCLSSSFGGSKK